MRGAMIVLAAMALATASAAAEKLYPVRTSVAKAERLHRKGDYAAAVAAVDAVLAAHPDDPVALAVRANSLIELGEYRRAMADHDASLAMAPRSPNAWNNACWSRALAGEELDEALRLCDGAVKASPDLAKYDTRGFLRLRRGEYALAVADYTAAIRLYPKLADALHGRGVARLRLGDEAAGRADIAAAAKLNPKIAETFARRGVRVE